MYVMCYLPAIFLVAGFRHGSIRHPSNAACGQNPQQNPVARSIVSMVIIPAKQVPTAFSLCNGALLHINEKTVCHAFLWCGLTRLNEQCSCGGRELGSALRSWRCIMQGSRRQLIVQRMRTSQHRQSCQSPSIIHLRGPLYGQHHHHP
ncbi:uncharacterized protein B0T15DRAFT_197110 [Chaetomium strumarium]|uniref:Uncharacterized protein n=1 Tax=Chaetomium strumarium TaxID=1170767 RepID=A0AAJ0GSS2_9PEZI|nr:hypothetical protein B0T15DRAFT_197110 [Chaetomium strumarium]